MITIASRIHFNVEMMYRKIDLKNSLYNRLKLLKCVLFKITKKIIVNNAMGNKILEILMFKIN
jgi:hypothetical protein